MFKTIEMSYLVQELTLMEPKAIILVHQLMKKECEFREPYQIIDLDLPHMKSYTPDELIAFGNWLIQQAQYVKDNYTPTGRRIKTDKNGNTQ